MPKKCWPYVFLLFAFAAHISARSDLDADQLKMLVDSGGWQYIALSDVDGGIQTTHTCFDGQPHPDICSGTLTLSAFNVQHGRIPALGYRIADAAYTPDLNDIPAESWPYLEHLELWIVDGLRYTGHSSHFSLNDALSWIERFKPKRAVITNMTADLDYDALRKSLPANVIPAYDGMRLTLD